MKTLIVDILLFHPQHPDEVRTEVRVPVSETVARRLMRSQTEGMILLDQTVLYNLAGAIGCLNGRRGIPLRVREADE